MPQVIHIHPEAPAKPPVGTPCNGCGLCCLAEPCPVGMLISRRRHGACAALHWMPDESRYRCGLLLKPVRGGAGRLWRWWSARLISAGSGCDAWIEVPQRTPPKRP